ncbi:hypothetical protein J7M00_00345 [bacterium]|nr:hypothetical protein [bacterium]
MKRCEEKESILERYLCYRALVLAMLGKSAEAETWRLLLRMRKQKKSLFQHTVNG